MSSSSSYTMVSGMSSACGSAPAPGGGTATAIASPALTRWPGSRIVRAADRDLAVEDQRLEPRARQRRRRGRPARGRAARRLSASPITTVSLAPACSIHERSARRTTKSRSIPRPARIVAKVRWLMLISGVTTVLAHRRRHRRHRLSRFQGRGKRARRPMSPRCCRRARAIIATAVAEDRIAVTIDDGGGIEIRTFDPGR